MRLALATLLAVAAGVLVGAVAVGGLGIALGYALFADEEPETGLPAGVLQTQAALVEAAKSGDYEQLRPLIPDTGFTYTFGEPVQDGPIGTWRSLETPRPVIGILAQILEMPYTLSRGYYVWPFAYDVASVKDLSAHERELLEPLGPLGTLFAPGTGYLGWRAGIAPDGTWTFFVAGD